MSQGTNWEELLGQVIDAAQREGQPYLIDLSAGPLPAREEQLLAALPQLITDLRGQGVDEEELFAAVVAALREEHRVGCGVYYPTPNHELVSLARFAPDRELPVTARAAAEVDDTRCGPGAGA